MKKRILCSILGLSALSLFCIALMAQGVPPPYRGAPYKDQYHSGGPQVIPGRIQCACYDTGGEGVAYHDSDAKNNGSGNLNPANGTYLNEFRLKEGVDTSYTKFHDEIDNSPYNMVQPEKDQLYVGWTEPGEWFSMSVSVKTAGIYTIGLMCTSNRGGSIGLDLDNKKLTDPLPILSTNDPRDPVPWRQWHHWNKMANIATVTLPAGEHVLTLHVIDQGNMNFDYLEFTLKKPAQ
jgi:hypothetical protein